MDIESQLAEMIISDIPLTDTRIISRVVEFLGAGAILALALVSKRLRDLVQEICPSLVSVPHMSSIYLTIASISEPTPNSQART